MYKLSYSKNHVEIISTPGNCAEYFSVFVNCIGRAESERDKLICQRNFTTLHLTPMRELKRYQSPLSTNKCHQANSFLIQWCIKLHLYFLGKPQRSHPEFGQSQREYLVYIRCTVINNGVAIIRIVIQIEYAQRGRNLRQIEGRYLRTYPQILGPSRL